ncbi:MAG: hypothetical protein J6S67_03905 [Methanobrevibacter sp.]|nr:hypothetical protein [Methanobrevibacter sp.]
MAIDKKIENEFGAEFSYHKLREVRIVNDDKVGIQLVMTVYSWVNKQARIDGKQPTVRQCIIMAADFAMTPFYALLKAKFPEFTTGEDDYDNSFKVVPSGNAEFVEQTGAGKLLGRWREAEKSVNDTAGSKPAAEV